jgi:putative FmdB family regulatory protein
MPLYEYQCEACGNRFEKIQKFSDPLVDVCPKCGGPVHKLMSSPAIQFKGTGWYITDYAKKDGGARDSKSGTSETKDGKDTKDTKDRKDGKGAEAKETKTSADGAKDTKSSSSDTSTKAGETKST